MKLQVRLDLTTGQLPGTFLDHGRTPDGDSVAQRAPVPRGGLRSVDLGYCHLDTFREVGVPGSYFRSRYKPGTVLSHTDGAALDLAALLADIEEDPVELPALPGRRHRLPVRLLAVRAPPRG